MRGSSFWSRSFHSVFKHRRIAIMCDSEVKYINLPTRLQVLLTIAITLSCIYVSVDYFFYKKEVIQIKDQKEEVEEVRQINQNLAEDVQKITTQIDEISQAVSGEKSHSISNQIKVNLESTEGLLNAKKAINSSLETLNAQLDAKREVINNKLAKFNLLKNYTSTDTFDKFQNISSNLSSRISYKQISFAGDIIESNLQTILKKAQSIKKMKSILSSLPIGKPVSASQITSHFGMRNHPKFHVKMFHSGIDFSGHRQASIIATGSGFVKISEYSTSFGNYIVISHGNGIDTLYAHLSSRAVKVGQKVTKGQKIGIQGSTGRSTGEHLHYEVHVNGTPKNPIYFLNN